MLPGHTGSGTRQGMVRSDHRTQTLLRAGEANGLTMQAGCPESPLKVRRTGGEGHRVDVGRLSFSRGGVFSLPG